MNKPNTQAAKTLGTIAYANGINAPALDVEITKMLIGRQVGDKRTIPELKAWVDGWTEASLAS